MLRPERSKVPPLPVMVSAPAPVITAEMVAVPEVLLIPYEVAVSAPFVTAESLTVPAPVIVSAPIEGE